MKINEVITEGVMTNIGNRIKGAFGNHAAAGKADAAAEYNKLWKTFERWRGQAGLEYGASLTGAAIKTKMGDEPMLDAMRRNNVRANNAPLSKEQAQKLVQTYAQLQLTGASGTGQTEADKPNLATKAGILQQINEISPAQALAIAQQLGWVGPNADSMSVFENKNYDDRRAGEKPGKSTQSLKEIAKGYDERRAGEARPKSGTKKVTEAGPVQDQAVASELIAAIKSISIPLDKLAIKKAVQQKAGMAAIKAAKATATPTVPKQAGPVKLGTGAKTPEQPPRVVNGPGGFTYHVIGSNLVDTKNPNKKIPLNSQLGHDIQRGHYQNSRKRPATK